jgi:hypothetical protein
VTFVDWEDIARWQMIDRALKLPFKDPIETYSTSDHVYTGLNIPAGTKGMLPKASRTRAGLAAETVEDLGETGKKRKDAGSHGERKSDRGERKSDRGERKSDRGERKSDHKSKPTDAPKAADDDAPKRKRQRRRTRGGTSAAPASPED